MNFSEYKPRLVKWSSLFVATGFGSGYIPLAPGTWGSLVGVGMVWLLWTNTLFFQVALTLFLLGVGKMASAVAGKHFGVSDSQKIVVDEIVGIMVTMIGIPVTGYWLFWGFLFFRFFDVAKFPPADYFDAKMHNAWGVMLDDFVAGLYSNLCLHLMWRATV
jgi:phosphatidylglycerophosphatase A